MECSPPPSAKQGRAEVTLFLQPPQDARGSASITHPRPQAGGVDGAVFPPPHHTVGGWGVAPRSRGWGRLSSECWQALLDPPLPGEKEAHCLPRRHTSGPVSLSAWECLGGWLHRLLCPTLRVSEAVGLGGAQEFTCQPALQVTLILLV